MIDSQTFVNLALVLVFVVIGGVFAATELALVSLREGQVNQLEQQGGRQQKTRVHHRPFNCDRSRTAPRAALVVIAA